MVIEIDVLLQELIPTCTSLSTTTLFPCVAPNPVPVIVTCPPTGPVVAEILVITGAGVEVEVTETLSTVTVTSVLGSPPSTPRPMKTSDPMLMVCGQPICAQFTPSEE